MKKLDKNRNVTQEYLDYVSSLKREDLETFYVGADLLVDRLNNNINKAIETLGEWTIFETSACTDRIISETLDILKGVGKNEKET